MKTQLAQWAQNDIDEIKAAWREFHIDLFKNTVNKFVLICTAALVAFLILLPWLTESR